MTIPLIVQAWRDPDVLLSLSEPAWEELVAQGRRTQLLARLAARVAAAGMLPQLPHGPRRALGSELRVAVHESDVVRWETMCLERALASACSELILSKGAAYLLTDLSIAKGRISSDVDVLVPSGRFPAAEAALLANGWVHVKLEPYDQLYYRQWTHELPPLQHAERGNIRGRAPRHSADHQPRPATGRRPSQGRGTSCRRWKPLEGAVTCAHGRALRGAWLP
ncbi:MAG: nucleotidyltransferase family protein [Vicinamibacterales bacterium]